jgi:hypothetical protein
MSQVAVKVLGRRGGDAVTSAWAGLPYRADTMQHVDRAADHGIATTVVGSAARQPVPPVTCSGRWRRA